MESALIEDVTMRKQSAHRLQQSRNRFVDAAPSALEIAVSLSETLFANHNRCERSRFPADSYA
jgi:hypothetical protein